jgi:hypothetical protein
VRAEFCRLFLLLSSSLLFCRRDLHKCSRWRHPSVVRNPCVI